MVDEATELFELANIVAKQHNWRPTTKKEDKGGDAHKRSR
jgi:hypothetical protein